MRSFKKYISAMLCLAIVSAVFASCRGDQKADAQSTAAESAEKIVVIGENSFYSSIELSEYVSLCEYKGLVLDISNTDGAREDMEKAINDHIYENSKIKKYPSEPLKYYFEQEKNFYLHLAKNDLDQYEALLNESNISEATFEELAKKYVAEDLIFYAITEAEGISVSADEKAELFDKYVKEYVNTYGYTEEYVRENLADLIYDSMLYDKTMEFLIANNSFAIN